MWGKCVLAEGESSRHSGERPQLFDRKMLWHSCKSVFFSFFLPTAPWPQSKCLSCNKAKATKRLTSNSALTCRIPALIPGAPARSSFHTSVLFVAPLKRNSKDALPHPFSLLYQCIQAKAELAAPAVPCHCLGDPCSLIAWNHHQKEGSGEVGAVRVSSRGVSQSHWLSFPLG